MKTPSNIDKKMMAMLSESIKKTTLKKPLNEASIKDVDLKVGSKFDLPNGEVIKITKLFKEKRNQNDNWVEFNRSGGSGSQQGKNEGSVSHLRLFLNRFQAKQVK